MSADLKIQVIRPGKPPAVSPIVAGIYTIGSDSRNKIILPEGGVSSQHAILVLRNDQYLIEDLNSTNGTFVDETLVNGRVPFHAGQTIRIGDFSIIIQDGSSNANGTSPPPPSQAKTSPQSQHPTPPQTTPPVPPTPPPKPAVEDESLKLSKQERERYTHIKQQIHAELLERLDLKRLTASRTGEEELQVQAQETIDSIVKDISSKLPEHIDPSYLATEIYNEAIKLGPLEELLEDDDITEIMVNGHDQIYTECKGKLTLSEKTFVNDTSVLAIIERIVSPLGRRIDESSPYVDARLADGSRVNAVIPPLALDGPSVTIRKFSKIPFTASDLVNFGSLTDEMVELISVCVKLRKNIIVAGGTGSGKTSLLNVVSSFLPDDERIVTIEDAAELRLSQKHVVRLESRPPNIEGKGAITIRDLVKNSLRMRPDRIVVGECRGGEALDMLQAMNTGHDGSLTTIHANTPRDVLSRLETLVLMSGMDLPVRAIREQVASAVDLIVHINRFSDGTRKVVYITEIVGLEGDKITMQDIFEFRQSYIDEDGKVFGDYVPTGSVPTFMEEMRTRGMTLPDGMFTPKQPGL